MAPPVVAIVGLSNSGKTRVATALIQRLTAEGYRIAAIKHCPHGHQVDRPGSDSSRLAEAGAAVVVLSSPSRITSIERARDDMPLVQIVASLDPGYDLVIAEGFKSSDVPKVLVVGQKEISPLPQKVIAVVSDTKALEGLPSYSFAEMDRLGDQIQKQYINISRSIPSISLSVNGVAVPLGEFPSRALAGILMGFVKTLKDVPPEPQSLRLVLEEPTAPHRNGKSPEAAKGNENGNRRGFATLREKRGPG